MDRRKFKVGDKEYNSQTITKMNETNKEKVHHSNKYRSKYIVVLAEYNKIPVKLFYIKYINAQKWTLLLTTDMSLSFLQAMNLLKFPISMDTK
jgi:hypothetical protein